MIATTPAHRRLRPQVGSRTASATPSPRIEVRDTLIGAAPASSATGSHLRSFPCSAGSNACCSAKGSNMIRTEQNSSGCVAVADTRAKRPREVSTATAFWCSPGICTHPSRSRPRMNSRMPMAAMTLAHTTSTRSSFASRAGSPIPAEARKTTQAQEASWIRPRSAAWVSSSDALRWPTAR